MDLTATRRIDMADAAEQAASVLRMLSNPSRLLILCQLIDGEMCVSDIEDSLDLGQAYVSQQLARLRDENIVVARREGRQMMYSISDPRVVQVIETLYREFCK
jgi:ArsR family transcriptional regulator